MFVIKVGGSLFANEKLIYLLQIARQQKYPIIFLPGGGPFADLVREQQKKQGFSDKAAHRMAIMAMQQFAEVLHESSSIAFWDGEKSIDSGPLLFPPIDLLAFDWNLPEDWSVSSDSLAIQLAIELKAEACILLKACESINTHLSMQELSSADVVDEYAPNLIEQFSGTISVVSIQDFSFNHLLQVQTPL